MSRYEDCGHRRIAYNSCRNRHCPKCQGAAARDWLAARQADLLPVDYFHLVVTLPAEIAPIAYQSKAVVYDLLFRAAAETLLTIAADPRHLGAHIGATTVLHSWGSAMTHHPHVHMIVPGGGISLDGTRWVSCRPGFLLPVRVLSRLFRRLFLTGLADAHAAGRLAFFGEIECLRRRRPSPLISRRCDGRTGSSMPSRPSPGPRRCSPILPAHPRVAISNSRLVALDERDAAQRAVAVGIPTIDQPPSGTPPVHAGRPLADPAPSRWAAGRRRQRRERCRGHHGAVGVAAGAGGDVARHADGDGGRVGGHDRLVSARRRRSDGNLYACSSTRPIAFLDGKAPRLVVLDSQDAVVFFHGPIAGRESRFMSTPWP
jgi:Putative transposase/Transposase zinc-binding domain